MIVAVAAWFVTAAPVESASAQPREYAPVTVLSGAPSARAEIFERQLETLAEAEGLRRAPLVDEGGLPSALPPERLDALARADALMNEAGSLAVALREGEALARLAEARRILREHADVPGAGRWMAEVETRAGVIALAAGLDGLGESALRAAATLDPERRLGSAEAPPRVVDYARRVAVEVSTAPRGRFRVFVEGRFATVYLDDQLLGPAPATVDAAIGRHLLRVEARGYRPWGQVVDVFEGRAPDVHVRLSPGPELALRRALADAGARGDAPAVETLMRRAPDVDVGEVWLLEASPARERALWTRCTREGCEAPRRLTRDGAGAATGPWSPEARRRAWAWLNAPPPPPPPPRPFYRRPGLWIAVGAAVVAGAVTAAIVTRPAPEHRLVVEPRPGDL